MPPVRGTHVTHHLRESIMTDIVDLITTPTRRYPRVGVEQEQADHAIGNIIEAIQDMALAINDAAMALMFYLPARGAEPEPALQRLDTVKKRCLRAVDVADNARHPLSRK